MHHIKYYHHQLLTNPWELSGRGCMDQIREDRVYCRGIGDNLGPLLLRLHALGELTDQEKEKLPGLVFVIHGDEEVGIPLGHIPSHSL